VALALFDPAVPPGIGDVAVLSPSPVLR